jgi:hypothetical protein
LWDTTLVLPNDKLSTGEVHRHEVRGPANARVLVAERGIKLTIKGRPMPVHVTVAVDLARVSAAGQAFAKELAAALCVLGLVLAVATYIQVTLGLRPLAVLRRDIADIRSGRSHRLSPAAPVEVQPLVDEVNALVEMQEQEIERSRSRAADLAHGLKTPLAALVSDAARLRERGEHTIARDIEAAGEAMSRHVDREMTRARVRASVHRGAGASTELAPPSSIHSSRPWRGPLRAYGSNSSRAFRMMPPRRSIGLISPKSWVISLTMLHVMRPRAFASRRILVQPARRSRSRMTEKGLSRRRDRRSLNAAHG